MNTRQRAIVFLALSSLLGGCVTQERAAPAASPRTVVVAPTTTDRVVAYPEGRYELRGDGSAAAPYYWVWIPAGATTPGPPPAPSPTR
jgi:hypothetical protein